MHTNDVIDSDFSFMDSEPLDIYSRQDFSDEQLQDTVYGTEEEFNTLFYDLDNDSDNDDLENDRSVSQCQSLISLPRMDSKDSKIQRIQGFKDFYICVRTAKYTISVSCSSYW